MPAQPAPWSIDQSGGQWVLSYGDGSGAFIKLYGRGPLTEKSEGDPRVLARKVADEIRTFPVAAPKQVHGNTVIRAKMSFCLPERPEADGLFLDETGIIGSLQYADCVPVVICGRSPCDWLALGHSGFAGTGKNIVSAMLSLALKTWGSQSLENVTAWVGPGICGNCYGRRLDDPWTQWGKKVFPREYAILKDKKVYFDLPGMIEKQLLDFGISEDAVFRIPFCTRCRNDLFYSYRAGDRHRNFLLARMLEPGHKLDHMRENNCSGPGVSRNSNSGV